MLIRLDYLRGFASFYVLLAHLLETTEFMIESSFIEVFKQGQVAVILFFILSGFVINYNYCKKKISIRTYFIKRFRRIYPLFLISLILSSSLAWLADVIYKRSLIELFYNILNLQDLEIMPGNLARPYFNAPLWSLSYEWFFYLLYIPVLMLTRKYKLSLYNISVITFIFGSLMYVLFPNKIFLNLIYFVIWATGADIGEDYVKNKFYSSKLYLKHAIFFSFTFSIIFIIYSFQKYTLHDNFEYVFRIFLHFLYSFVIISIAFFWQQIRWKFFDKIFSFFNNIAPFSYALYIFHQPVLIMFFKNYGNRQLDPMEVVFSLIFIFVFSWYCEVKLQPKINLLFKPLIKK